MKGPLNSSWSCICPPEAGRFVDIWKASIWISCWILICWYNILGICSCMFIQEVMVGRSWLMVKSLQQEPQQQVRNFQEFLKALYVAKYNWFVCKNCTVVSLGKGGKTVMSKGMEKWEDSHTKRRFDMLTSTVWYQMCFAPYEVHIHQFFYFTISKLLSVLEIL